ncbi:uncharacterized protein KIAA1958-like [Mercenaria mercenaria]|uniref:uncharacterized protein KIAA1958-like n=1 Tax=Mercenaria mercenaria TaxID=6596 RepID=UPI00234F65CB|nr:uncharacterized protein KIAA1958-like [Mercenaria mercenaria]
MSVEELDPEVLNDIFTNFFDQEEYGDFQVADRNFRQVDADQFLKENENKNTQKKTESDMKLFFSFLMSKNEMRKPEYIPPYQLNSLLCEFILGVTKKDGREYEPTTLRGFISSVDRYLKKTATAERPGLGNKPRAAETMTESIIDQMHEARTLGDYTPRSLLHSMWFVCTNHFGMRTGKECRDLCWGDIHLRMDETSGGEYLIYDQERQTKTRSGSNPRDIRGTKPKAYATADAQRDPVHLYKLYSQKRPDEMCKPDSPFFLTPNDKPQRCWFKKTPLGINKLYNIMRDMKAEAGIENPRITPYSSRKHLVQTLNDAGVPANQIMQISGHKNVNSINNYSKINNDQSRNISKILSNQRNETNLQTQGSGAASAPERIPDSSPPRLFPL